MKPDELRALREAAETLIGWTMTARTPEERALLPLAEYATPLVGIAEDVAKIEAALAAKVPAAEVDPLVLAREAVAHHRGILVINGRWRLAPESRRPTPAPWVACASVTHPPGEPGDYVERTHRNVLDSTATLIVRPSIGFRSPGTVMTMDYASKIGAGRPGGVWRFRRSVSLDDDQGRVIALWVPVVDLRVLNIAGPRESKAPGIYASTLALLREVWP